MTHTEARRQCDLQIKVLDRAFRELDLRCDRLSLVMDLDSIPELDLEKLLNAPKFDFAHDIYGIRRHMDRTSFPGKLTDCFWPRCCKQTV